MLGGVLGNVQWNGQGLRAEVPEEEREGGAEVGSSCAGTSEMIGIAVTNHLLLNQESAAQLLEILWRPLASGFCPFFSNLHLKGGMLLTASRRDAPNHHLELTERAVTRKFYHTKKPPRASGREQTLGVVLEILMIRIHMGHDDVQLTKS